jgi:hypothetical protein
VVTKKAFLRHLGNRKWRKVSNSIMTVRKNYLKYLGNRKWKRRDGIIVIFNALEIE